MTEAHPGILERFTGDAKTSSPAACPPHILIFEAEAEGHQAFYIGHLIRYIRDERPELKVLFALGSDLVERLSVEARKALVDPAVPCCTLRVLPAKELSRLRASNLVVRGLYQWFYVMKLARDLCVSHVHFQYFDHSFLGATLPLQRLGPMTYSGLLFRPSIHYAVEREVGTPLSERWRDWLKGRLYRQLLSNCRLTAAYSLDRYFGEYSERHFAESGKIVFVPDPVCEEINKLAIETPGSTGERVSFLLFGALARRKGVLAILQALDCLPDDVAAHCHVRFAGGVDPVVRETFYAHLKRLQSDSNGAQVDVIDRYLDDGEIADMVTESDVILVPYQRHVGSSGLLYWAAAARKPVITQDYGLIGREARDFCLGLAIDTLSERSLAEAMATAIRAGGRGLACADGQARFIEGHSGRDFAAALIDGMADRRETVT